MRNLFDYRYNKQFVTLQSAKYDTIRNSINNENVTLDASNNSFSIATNIHFILSSVKPVHFRG